jgi:hypothetical protein
MYSCVVIQYLVDLNAPLFEFKVKAKLQVGLVEPPMLVVTVLREDLPNMAPFYILTAVSKGPWLRYILPPLECQLLQVPEDI